MVIYCGFWFVCYGGFLGCLYNFLLCMMMMEEYTGVHVYMCPCEEVFMCTCIWRWWMSVHVTESASDLPSSRVFTLTSSVPTSLPPEHRIFNVWQSSSESWSLFWFWHWVTWWGCQQHSLSRGQSHKSSSCTCPTQKSCQISTNISYWKVFTLNWQVCHCKIFHLLLELVSSSLPLLVQTPGLSQRKTRKKWLIYVFIIWYLPRLIFV